MNNSEKLDLKNILNNSNINNSIVNNSKTNDSNKINDINNIIYIPNTFGDIYKLLDTHNNITNKPWSKLDKSHKIKILNNFIEKEKKDNDLSQETYKQLKNILHKALYNNLLNKQQDVVYDIEKKIIIKINSLTYNSDTKTYEIKIKEKGGGGNRVTSKSKTNIDRLISSGNKRKK